MVDTSHFYGKRTFDTSEYLELVSLALFKMALVMNRITQALERKDFEEVFHLSEKGWKILGALEASLQENEETQENFKEFIQFCQTMVVYLKKVNVEANTHLSTQMADAFKKMGIYFQDKHKELENSMKQPTHPFPKPPLS